MKLWLKLILDLFQDILWNSFHDSLLEPLKALYALILFLFFITFTSYNLDNWFLFI